MAYGVETQVHGALVSKCIPAIIGTDTKRERRRGLLVQVLERGGAEDDEDSHPQ